MGLFRLLFYFLIGYFIFRFISLVFRPNTKQGSNFNQQQNKKRKEGDISINVDKSANTKRIPKDEGDYVDYEDV
jgi:hypothetical protein